METKICTRCKLSKPVDEFYRLTASVNQKMARCMPCTREVNNARHRQNREKRYVAKAVHRQDSVGNWLKTKYHNIKRSMRKDQCQCPQHPGLARCVCSVTLDYLYGLWDKQEGKCALTGVQMTTKFDCLFSASIDRIDSKFGYFPGNVQLACKAANLAKCTASNEAMQEWVKAIRLNG